MPYKYDNISNFLQLERLKNSGKKQFADFWLTVIIEKNPQNFYFGLNENLYFMNKILLNRSLCDGAQGTPVKFKGESRFLRCLLILNWSPCAPRRRSGRSADRLAGRSWWVPNALMSSFTWQRRCHIARLLSSEHYDGPRNYKDKDSGISVTF